MYEENAKEREEKRKNRHIIMRNNDKIDNMKEPMLKKLDTFNDTDKDLENNFHPESFVDIYSKKVRPHRLSLSIVDHFFGKDIELDRAALRYVFTYNQQT